MSPHRATRLTAYAALAALAAVLGSIVIPQRASAQAWTRDQGHFYANLSYRYLAAGSLYGPDFHSRPIASTYRQHVVGVYGEVGLVSRWLTAQISSEAFRYEGLDDQGSTYGMGDARIGLFSGLLVAPFHLSAGLVLGLPLGDDRPTAGAGGDAGAQEIAATLPTGDGEFDVEAIVAAGHGWGGGSWPLRHYATASIGYWLRTRGIADSFTYKLETGVRIDRPFADRFLLIVRLAGVESFASNAEAAAGFSGLGQGVTYTSIGAELAFRIQENLGVSVGYETALRARSIAASSVIKVAISVER